MIMHPKQREHKINEYKGRMRERIEAAKKSRRLMLKSDNPKLKQATSKLMIQALAGVSYWRGCVNELISE